MKMLSVELLFAINLIFIFMTANSIHKNFSDCSFAFDSSSITAVTPMKYYVQLTINPEERIMSNTVDIMIYINSSMTNISLYMYEKKINPTATKIMMINLSSNCNPEYNEPNLLQNYSYCEENDILNLVFKNKLILGYYCMHLEFTSALSDDHIIKIPYYTDEGHKKWLVTNLYAPTAIQRLFPTWDDPTIRSSFNISVKHSKNYTVLSNGPTWYKSIDEYGIQWTYFREVSAIPSSQLAIVMINDVKQLQKYKNINFIWCQSNKTERFKFAHNRAHSIIGFFTAYLRVPHTFRKFDHIVVPTNASMKSAGKYQLIIYREKDIIYDETLDNFGQDIAITRLMMYEMTRQWFVSLTTPHLIRDIWINEMLSSFYSYYMTSEFFGYNEFMSLFVVQNLQTALDADIFLELESIIHKSKDDNGIDGLLYPLLYHKKAFALIRMLCYILTEEVFRTAIGYYMHEGTEDLWTVLERYYVQRNNNSRYTIREIMDSWLTTPYHPVLRVIKNNNKRIVSYSQKTAGELSSYSSKWKIPINFITMKYTTKSKITSYNTSNITWFEHNQVKIINHHSVSDFYIINAEQFGFYRVNYDNKNWLLISSYLQFHNYENIPVINRAQLINDAYYYTINNELDSFIFNEIIQYLKHETNFIPWYPMFNILIDMSDYLNLNESHAIKVQFMHIIHKLAQYVGYAERVEEDGMRKALRLLALKWNCRFNNWSCKTAATTRLLTYVYDTSRVPSSWKNWVLCTGMMKTSPVIWNTILQQSYYKNDMEYLEYLTCTENVELIIHYLDFILHGHITETEKVQMVKIYLSIVKKHTRRDTVLTYLLDNYHEAVKKFPVDFGNGTLMGHIIMSAYSEETLEQIHAFANRTFYCDNYQMWYVIGNTSAARNHQITKQTKKFEMF